ncbi:hypothetical protein JHN52_20485 [Streptomyces sp. MBT97]|uniref:hypothetical protein n=1 Tax=Streptomyces sp. MBT97 TaxID=2800411 RepID=UPI00190B7A6C|nr:hypothetical protein [Streptomyces sp. MBT97]MBK3635258.1 hypothetical protein [Streptomyces sp. MBT97]
MLTEALAAPAAAGGTAVAQAAGTSLWEGTRSRVARLFGRGDAARHQDAPARSERFEVSGNTFAGPTALQVGDGNTQEITFGRTP